jgi:O-antigen chain-terminating methyltransferase
VRAANGALTGARRGFTHLESEVERVEGLVAEARALAQSTLDGLESARIELSAARRMIAEESRKLSRLIEDARQVVPQAAAPALEALGEPLVDSVYLAFENRFRGPVGEISARQSRYLDLFRGNARVAGGGTVLDIGCGRGEWLSLLKGANIHARGIDLNPAMAAHTDSLGLEVLHGDAIAHLKSLPEGTLAAVTGFHIVEHLSFKDLLSLLGEAYRALAPGGIILFETPNPENLVVGACTFNYDPTHNKPLPPDLLRFLAETRGFVDGRIVRTDADCRLDQPESGFTPTELNDWFRQPADYALYARKPDTAAT